MEIHHKLACHSGWKTSSFSDQREYKFHRVLQAKKEEESGFPCLTLSNQRLS
uniref:Uncharacterized protein n=1 Tax=Arundo donax TaxID=35708 RepID=A0A0A9GIA3_ARUDO